MSQKNTPTTNRLRKRRQTHAQSECMDSKRSRKNPTQQPDQLSLMAQIAAAEHANDQSVPDPDQLNEMEQIASAEHADEQSSPSSCDDGEEEEDDEDDEYDDDDDLSTSAQTTHIHELVVPPMQDGNLQPPMQVVPPMQDGNLQPPMQMVPPMQSGNLEQATPPPSPSVASELDEQKNVVLPRCETALSRRMRDLQSEDAILQKEQKEREEQQQRIDENRMQRELYAFQRARAIEVDRNARSAAYHETSSTERIVDLHIGSSASAMQHNNDTIEENGNTNKSQKVTNRDARASTMSSAEKQAWAEAHLNSSNTNRDRARNQHSMNGVRGANNNYNLSSEYEAHGANDDHNKNRKYSMNGARGANTASTRRAAPLLAPCSAGQSKSAVSTLRMHNPAAGMRASVHGADGGNDADEDSDMDMHMHDMNAALGIPRRTQLRIPRRTPPPSPPQMPTMVLDEILIDADLLTETKEVEAGDIVTAFVDYGGPTPYDAARHYYEPTFLLQAGALLQTRSHSYPKVSVSYMEAGLLKRLLSRTEYYGVLMSELNALRPVAFAPSMSAAGAPVRVHAGRQYRVLAAVPTKFATPAGAAKDAAIWDCHSLQAVLRKTFGLFFDGIVCETAIQYELPASTAHKHAQLLQDGEGARTLTVLVGPNVRLAFNETERRLNQHGGQLNITKRAPGAEEDFTVAANSDMVFVWCRGNRASIWVKLYAEIAAPTPAIHVMTFGVLKTVEEARRAKQQGRPGRPNGVHTAGASMAAQMAREWRTQAQVRGPSNRSGWR